MASLVNGSLGEAVGQIYVQRHYPAESDRQMGELIANIRAALQEKIETNDWMDEATRKEALAKLAAFDPRTGHPIKYIDYSSIKVDRADPLGNVMRAGQFDWDLLLTRMKKPVDRTLWDMTPQTNNAYYDPPQNQITFPAAILQPPYFDPTPTRPPTTAHRRDHRPRNRPWLRRSGPQVRRHGKLRDWWTPAAAKYDAHATRW